MVAMAIRMRYLMTNEAFIDLVQRLHPDNEAIHTVEITEEEIADLTREQADELVALYGSSMLITLPSKEREFFAWLRQNDEPIWNDLWEGDETPYQVSLSYLPDLLPNRRGFAICDLMDHQNFHFTVDNISREEGAGYLDAALSIIGQDGRLSMEQAFVVEVWRAPIDQWRFAYMYGQPLEQVKSIVQWLIAEEILAPVPEETDQESNSLQTGLEQE